MSGKPTIPYHWLADLQPMMNEAEFASLKASIATDKQTDKGKLFEGKLLDGRNRERACRELGIVFKHEPFVGTFEQAFAYVCAKLYRAEQRAAGPTTKAAPAAPAGRRRADDLVTVLRAQPGQRGEAIPRPPRDLPRSKKDST